MRSSSGPSHVRTAADQPTNRWASDEAAYAILGTRYPPEPMPRIVVTDATFPIMQVGVADAAGLDGDERLARTRVRNHDGDDFDGCVLGFRDDAIDVGCHASLYQRSPAGVTSRNRSRSGPARNVSGCT